MTTNRPETLDTALVRPGRVDHQISFTLATHEQIRDMYSRMYSPDQDADHAETSPTAIMTPGQVQISTHEQPAICEDLPFDLYPYLPKALVAEPKKVADLAKQFADKLPENTFSPADIQGFLLKRRRDPEGALRDVETWRDEYIEQMRVAKKGFI
jgi:chaperone BCS1